MAKIGLDIGHGVDTFPPSKGVYKNGKGYAEHSFNAKLGVAIKKLLEKQGHVVILGQQPNKKDVPLRARTNLYNREKVALVVSLHANYNANSDVNGRCVFYWHTSSRSKSLAEAIRDEMGAKGYSTHGDGLHASERGSWTNLHMVRETSMPAVLVEHGFMSGTSDFNLIFGNRQNQYIKDMAEANVRGIQAWLGLGFKGGAVVKTGWKKNNVGWWYVNYDGTYPKDKWQKINDTWYLFDKKGYMLTGWQKVKGTWYYMASSGAMQTGWVKLKNEWYYLNSNGAMATGWKRLADKWYYLYPSGKMATGLIEVAGKHYYLQRNGVLITDDIVKLEANKHGHLK